MGNTESIGINIPLLIKVFLLSLIVIAALLFNVEKFETKAQSFQDNQPKVIDTRTEIFDNTSQESGIPVADATGDKTTLLVFANFLRDSSDQGVDSMKLEGIECNPTCNAYEESLERERWGYSGSGRQEIWSISRPTSGGDLEVTLSGEVDELIITSVLVENTAISPIEDDEMQFDYLNHNEEPRANALNSPGDLVLGGALTYDSSNVDFSVKDGGKAILEEDNGPTGSLRFNLQSKLASNENDDLVWSGSSAGKWIASAISIEQPNGGIPEDKKVTYKDFSFGFGWDDPSTSIDNVNFSGDNIALIATAHYYNDDNDKVDNVKFDGQNFTNLCTADESGEHFEMFYLTSPNSTSGDVVFNYEDDNFDSILVTLHVLENVDPNNPVKDSVCGDNYDASIDKVKLDPDSNYADLIVGGGTVDDAYDYDISSGTNYFKKENAKVTFENTFPSNSVVPVSFLNRGDDPTFLSAVNVDSDEIVSGAASFRPAPLNPGLEPGESPGSLPAITGVYTGNSTVENVDVTGENTALVAMAHYRSNNESTSSVDFEGDAFNFACKDKRNEYSFDIFYLVNPGGGNASSSNSSGSVSGTVDFDLSGIVDDSAFKVVALENVNQNSTALDTVCDDDYGYNISLYPQTDSGGIVVGGATSYSGGYNEMSMMQADELYQDEAGINSEIIGFSEAGDDGSAITVDQTDGWPIAAGAVSFGPPSGQTAQPTSLSFDFQNIFAVDLEPYMNVYGTAINAGDYNISDVSVNLIGAIENHFTLQLLDGSYDSTEELFKLTPHEPLQPGSYSVEVTAEVDTGQGIDDYTQTYNFNVAADDTPPKLDLDSNIKQYENDKNLIVSGSATENYSYIDNLSVKAEERSAAPASAGANWITMKTENISSEDGVLADEKQETFSSNLSNFFNLEFGKEYRFTVMASNSSNVTADQVITTTLLDDTEGPRVESFPNKGQAPLSNTTLTFSGTIKDEKAPIDSMKYKINTGGWQDLNAVDGQIDSKTEDVQFTVSNLSDGQHVISLKLTDIVGNTTDIAVDRVVVEAEDNTAPEVTLYEVIPNPIVDPNPVLQGFVEDSDQDKQSNITTLEFKLGQNGSWQTLPVRDGAIGDEIKEDFSINLTNLAKGDYKVFVRAIDAAGNDTDANGKNATQEFTVEEQNANITPDNVKTEISFSEQKYHDRYNTDLIWGGGRLRLAEEMNPEETELISNENNLLGLRYKYGEKALEQRGVFDASPSDTGGHWFSLTEEKFAYHDGQQEFVFDISNYGGDMTEELEEVYHNGEYHLWVASINRLVGLNFGESITDGVDSYTSFALGTGNAIDDFNNLLEIDHRPEDGYGVYYNVGSDPVGGVRYVAYNDINFDNTNSPHPSSAENLQLTLNNTVDLFLDEDNNTLWASDYEDGITAINDNGTPTNMTDDTEWSYPSQTEMFKVGVDKDDKPFFVGKGGLFVVNDTNGTPTNTADDDIINLLGDYGLNFDDGAYAQYLPGSDAVPSQFFISNRSGYVYYLSTNGTYETDEDDQLIPLNLSQDQYPASLRRFYMPDNNTIVASTVHRNAAEYDLNRQFKETGTALTVTDENIDEYLDADYLRLLSATRIDSTEAKVDFEVSNDGGQNWYPLSVGETMDFPDNDYRVKLRITMHRGSTPILSDLALEYAAYPSDDPAERQLQSVELSNVPAQVTNDENFSFDITLKDDQGDVHDVNGTALIKLIRTADDQVIDSFSPQTYEITNGTATVTGANASVVGQHYLQVNFNQKTVQSSAIEFLAPDPEDKENNNSSNGNNNSNVGNQGGEQDSSVSSESSSDSSSSESSSSSDSSESSTQDQPDEDTPVVNDFKVEIVEELEDTVKVRVTWDVSDAELVEISKLGTNLPASGQRELEVDKDSVLQLVARNQAGSAYQKQDVSTASEVNPNPLTSSWITICGGGLGILVIAGLLIWWWYSREKQEDEEETQG